MIQQDDIRLTSFSHGSGCGCKISPGVLAEILSPSGETAAARYEQLLVGNAESDDAAVFSLGDGTAIISTTDFFMPIVDHPETFGHIASVNAISDVYAMGGRPLMAIAILGWPVNIIPHEFASRVMQGARTACALAGIPLAGGHSIDNPEPVFGLAVTGTVEVDFLKRNSGARVDDLLYLTKPLGVGILSTAQKKGIVKPEHQAAAIQSMMTLNTSGAQFGTMDFVHAMTDVTGFGLGGHLLEMCSASGVAASVEFDALPCIDRDALAAYIAEGCVPGGTTRNARSHPDAISGLDDFRKAIVFDPQTSGGLLVAVDPHHQETFETFLIAQGLPAQSIGKIVERDPNESNFIMVH